MYDMILVRYGEMTLKKSNYKSFLRKINENIKRKLEKYINLSFKNTDYRFYIYLNGENYENVIDDLNTIAGLSSYSLCRKVDNKIENIANESVDLINKARPKNKFTFKVETNRGDKNYPLTSIEISQHVARLVLPRVEGMSVDVHNPDLTLFIDLRSEGTYIYTEVIPGIGGYPSGIAGNGLIMISGGIDSPVATYLALRKGINLDAIHFASPPYTSDMALQKVIDILERLAAYTGTGKITLYNVPFTTIQMKINQKANHKYVVTLMRRAMYKIADMVARKGNYDCLINGESIGQVASQTLESMKVVNEVTNLPIIRPLATYDKQEIIKIARNIKTYDISIRPYEDCCTIFVPEHPIIRPKLEDVIIEESKCNLDESIIKAFNEIQIIEIDENRKTNIFNRQFSI
ncbi:MAG TPA: tRNA 4-thiouridine(8) synthase ThiI [Acholeplasmataceae bacterium]|jgi:thiamine biosynthesis protein ThiI|nr:tRNA 4-thiouridine(8) synthase ThiI [Acholeplasmataceae bacterium]